MPCLVVWENAMFCLAQEKAERIKYLTHHASFVFFPLCRHKVVIVEGNYLLLEDGAWKEISTMFDEKW